MAASTIAQYDTAWAVNYEGSVELLVRDPANWERDDTRFPYLRQFDAYAGHSWAAGHQGLRPGTTKSRAPKR